MMGKIWDEGNKGVLGRGKGWVVFWMRYGWMLEEIGETDATDNVGWRR